MFRATAPPRISYEELELRTTDGAVLHAKVDDPADGAPRGTAIHLHPLGARGDAFGGRDRPGLARALAARGLRTVALDLRGHGASTAPRPDFGYDDLVRTDVPAIVEACRASGQGPVVVVGHALGGHAALASQGCGHAAADAIVTLGADVWLRALEPSALRWEAKRALARSLLAIAAARGHLPARRLRIGTDDVPARLLLDLFAGIEDGTWRSADRRDDYLEALPRVAVPVAAVLGMRDRILCHPASGEAFARLAGGPVRVLATPHGHRALVSSPRARGVVIEAVEWALATRAEGTADACARA